MALAYLDKAVEHATVWQFSIGPCLQLSKKMLGAWMGWTCRMKTSMNSCTATHNDGHRADHAATHQHQSCKNHCRCKQMVDRPGRVSVSSMTARRMGRTVWFITRVFTTSAGVLQIVGGGHCMHTHRAHMHDVGVCVRSEDE